MRIRDLICDLENYSTLLLDRDGTINIHIVNGYVCKKEDFEFIPDFLEEIKTLSDKFRYVFVVTNQRGISKGLLSEEDLMNIHQYMIAEIEKVGGRIDNIYYSTAISDDDYYRKPNVGMFEQIMRDYPDVKPETTIMLGDGDVDMEFARNCGIYGIRVDSLKKEGDKYFWVKAQQ